MSYDVACHNYGNLFAMGAPIAIVLSHKDRKRYEQLSRSGKTPVRLQERLGIVLLANAGLTNGEIAERLSVSAHKVGRWRNRFAEQGLAGIEKYLPGGNNHGGKNTETKRDRRAIMAMYPIQFQPGMSLSELFEQYGTEAQ